LSVTKRLGFADFYISFHESGRLAYGILGWWRCGGGGVCRLVVTVRKSTHKGDDMKNWLVVLVLASSLLVGCNLLPQPIDNPPTTLEPQFTGWQFLGTNPLDVNASEYAGESRVAVDIRGNPVVSWVETAGTYINIYVKRWTGSNWVQLGGPLNVSAFEEGRQPSLAIDTSGNPVVSWTETAGSSYNIYVKRWNGTSWLQLGGELNIDAGRQAFNPSLALDSSGNPVVSWQERDGISYSIYVKRWNGTIWMPVGTTSLDIDFFKDAQLPSLAIDSSGNPVVSWEEDDGSSYNIYVKRWTGSSWVQLGTILDVNSNQDAYASSLAVVDSSVVASSGNPVVSWVENGDIYVKRWSGTSWVQLGGSLNVTRAENPKLAVDLSGNPVVSWNDHTSSFTSPNNLYVKKWDGFSWVQVGGSLKVDPNQHVLDTSLAVTFSGNLVMNWNEITWNSGGFYESNVYVKRYSTNVWRNLGGALDVTLSDTAYSTGIARTSANLPVVAFHEFSGFLDVGSYVKRWTGTTWQLYGGQVNTPGTSGVCDSVVIQSDGNPVVACSEGPANDNASFYVRRWTGTSWQDVGGVLSTNVVGGGYARLVLDSSNTPIVAFETYAGGFNYGLYVRKWNGSSWVGLDGTANPVASRFAFGAYALALDSTGKPSVAWNEFGTVYVKQWNGTSWVQRGTNVAAEAESGGFSLAVDSTGKPVVAYSNTSSVFVKRWTGTTWRLTGTALNQSTTAAYAPSLKLRRNNQPVVAYSEKFPNTSAGRFSTVARRWDGTSWVEIANQAVSNSSSLSGWGPQLVLKSNDNPIITYTENDNVYAKEY
jgi:hypothetical protein